MWTVQFRISNFFINHPSDLSVESVCLHSPRYPERYRWAFGLEIGARLAKTNFAKLEKWNFENFVTLSSTAQRKVFEDRHPKSPGDGKTPANGIVYPYLPGSWISITNRAKSPWCICHPHKTKPLGTASYICHMLRTKSLTNNHSLRTNWQRKNSLQLLWISRTRLMSILSARTRRFVSHCKIQVHDVRFCPKLHAMNRPTAENPARRNPQIFHIRHTCECYGK